MLFLVVEQGVPNSFLDQGGNQLAFVCTVQDH